MNIVVLDAYVNNPDDLDIGWNTLSDFGTVTLYDRTDRDELAERIADADIVVSSKILWNKETLSLAPNLKFIALTSTGYNVVNLEEATAQGILVSNVPAYSTPDVAQMAWALLLELCLHVGEHSRSVHEGNWITSKDFAYWDFPLVELAGKTMGIIGMGSIGRAVARIACAFDMEVLFHNRSPKPELENTQCRQAPFIEVLERADVVSLHVPATAETHNLIDRHAIAKMKDGAFLINTARGTLVNEHDIAAALRSGKLAGFGADVISHEPMLPDNPLLGAPNAVITPHIAWATQEARMRLLTTVFANVKAFCVGSPQNVVNP